MRTKLKRWGNSLAVRIPQTIASEIKLFEGDELILLSQGQRIVVTKAPQTETTPTLEELVAGITEENKHELWDWGKPVGKEVW
ncbi:MAG: AbrB/MazE/SpoVT family DNA-binding domain-containing protein [bacterium]